MNYREAITKIHKLLGLQKFNSYKVAETGQELILEGDLSVGEPIYMITENGQLPAPDGEFELNDTTIINIEDGKVQKINYDMEKQEQFVEATLADGVVVKSKTFDIGEDVFVVSPDGTETPAPDGEHELKLKGGEGEEVPFKIIVKDGKIVERMNIEKETPEQEKELEVDMGMVPDLSEGNDMIDESFKKEVMKKLDTLMEAISGMKKEYEDMEKKVEKFGKLPAGDPVRQPKNAVSDMLEAKNDKIAQLMRIRANIK
jgi:major membrane immunogen (membrane-anchored lipoprotein)